MNQDERPRMGNGWPSASTSTRPSSDGRQESGPRRRAAVSDAPRRTHPIEEGVDRSRSSVHSEGHDSGMWGFGISFTFVPAGSGRQGFKN